MQSKIDCRFEQTDPDGDSNAAVNSSVKIHLAALKKIRALVVRIKLPVLS
jgi:hypothetical protein